MLEPRPPVDVEKLDKPPMELQYAPGFEKETVLLPKLEPGLVLSPIEGSSLLVLTFDKAPQHPSDPLCFSFPVKAWTTLLAALLVMGVSCRGASRRGSRRQTISMADADMYITYRPPYLAQRLPAPHPSSPLAAT